MSEISLNRFLEAQKHTYDIALNEIRNGKKMSHWIWFIFPQIRGLGMSQDADYYGLSGLEEARLYLKNEILRNRLLEISSALLLLKNNNPTDILGFPDDLKLKSSMTLFLMAEPNCEIFQAILDKFYNGKRDLLTINLIDENINT